MQKCFWKIEPYLFCYLSIKSKLENSSMCFIFSLYENGEAKFLLLTSFRKPGWKPELWTSQLRYLEKFWKRWRINQNLSFWIIQKSALTFSSKNFHFQRCSELNQRCPEIFRYWTDLKVFWIRADHRWMSLRRQPGIIWNPPTVESNPILKLNCRDELHLEPIM